MMNQPRPRLETARIFDCRILNRKWTLINECKFRYPCLSVSIRGFKKKGSQKHHQNDSRTSIIMGVPLTPDSFRQKRKKPWKNSDGRVLKTSSNRQCDTMCGGRVHAHCIALPAFIRGSSSPSLPHRIQLRRFKVVVFSEESPVDVF